MRCVRDGFISFLIRIVILCIRLVISWIAMNFFKRLFAPLKNIFTKENRKSKYSPLSSERSVWLPLKNVDYGYGFINREGRVHLIFQYPVHYTMDKVIQQNFVKASTTLSEICVKTNRLVYQLILANKELNKHEGHLPEQMQAQWFNKNGTVDVLYESLKDIGETKDEAILRLRGCMIYGKVGYVMLKVPPIKSCTNSDIRKWKMFLRLLRLSLEHFKRIANLKGKGVAEYMAPHKLDWLGEGRTFRISYDI